MITRRGRHSKLTKEILHVLHRRFAVSREHAFDNHHSGARAATRFGQLTERLDVNMEREAKANLKERALEEFRLFWIIALYLWVFLGSFTIYRRLIIEETGAAYLHYGISLIEALVIAKVILIGKMFGFSRRFEDKPLIVPLLYKTILFGIFVLLFGVVEHLLEGWFHRQGLVGGLHDISDLGADELGARVLVIIVAFVPFFAFYEIGRVIGMRKLAEMFFSKRGTGE
jgi:hypothetical protein